MLAKNLFCLVHFIRFLSEEFLEGSIPNIPMQTRKNVIFGHFSRRVTSMYFTNVNLGFDYKINGRNRNRNAI